MRITDKQSEKISDLFDIARNPRRLILEGKKLGITGFKRLLLLIVLVGALNFIFLLLGILVWYINDFYTDGWQPMLAILVVGLACVAISIYLGYQFVIKKIVELIYIQLSSFFGSLCTGAAGYARNLLGKSDKLVESELKKQLSVAGRLKEHYNNAPALIIKGVNWLVQRIPFATLIGEIRSEILDGSEAEAGDALYNRLNVYLKENVFAGKNARFFLWLIPVNVVIQLLFLKVL